MQSAAVRAFLEKKEQEEKEKGKCGLNISHEKANVFLKCQSSSSSIKGI